MAGRGRLPGAAQGRGRRRRARDADRRPTPAELEDAYRLASAEAQAAFGDGGMYLEKAVVDPRHVEMQVLGRRAGGVLVLRRARLLGAAPAPEADRGGPVAGARRGDPRGAWPTPRGCACARLRLPQRRHGRVPARRRAGRFYFIEMNTRLQVEHPVIASWSPGVDLAVEQLRIAGGEPLPQTGPAPSSAGTRSSSVSTARIPRHDFRPAAGTVTRFRPPLGPGVRLDTHAYEGYRVPPFYDSLLAKLIVWGADRDAGARRAAGGRCASSRSRASRTTRELFVDIVERAARSARARTRRPTSSERARPAAGRWPREAAADPARRGTGVPTRRSSRSSAARWQRCRARGSTRRAGSSRVLPGRRGPVEWAVDRRRRRRFESTSSAAHGHGAAGARRARCAAPVAGAVARDDRPRGARGGRHGHRGRPRRRAAADEPPAGAPSGARAAFLLYQRDLTGARLRARCTTPTSATTASRRPSSSARHVEGAWDDRERPRRRDRRGR